MKPFRALLRISNEIGADGELRFLELAQAAIYRLCIVMDEEDVE